MRTRFVGATRKAAIFGLLALASAAAPSAALGQSQPTVEGLHFFLVENQSTRTYEQRGRAGSAGVAFPNLVLRPDTRYRIWVLQAQTLDVGSIELTTPSAGQRIDLPPFSLQPPSGHDTDADGLSDLGELIVSTDARDPDSDDDGVDDGPELRQGTDPLDGQLVLTGVIAAADTPGDAVDVCAINDVAVLADSTEGVSVFNVFSGLSPKAVARVPTVPDRVQRVTCSGTLVGATTDLGRFLVIDVTDPPAARVLHRLDTYRLGGFARCVASAGGVAYVGLNTGDLVAVDLAGGQVLDTVRVHTSALVDLAIEGDVLYALSATRVHALGLQPDDLVAGTQGPAVTAYRRLFVGGGIAYATSRFGYDTFQVSQDPGVAPVLLRATNELATQVGLFGWNHFVLNGSGLGLAAAGASDADDGTHDLSVFDTSDPLDTTAVVGLPFGTPGFTRAVAIYNGLCYVADGGSGLQVVSYVAQDGAGVPPTVSLSASFQLAPPQAVSGQRARVTASVQDDVQVRNVEFYLDGVKVATDGNFPFEHHFTTPGPERTSGTFTLQVRAADTGGNFTWSPLLVVELIADPTPPLVRTTAPTGGRVLGQVGTVAAFFTEPMDAASVVAGFTLLRDPNPTGALAYAPVSATVEYREAVGGAFLVFPAGLPIGRYLASLAGTIQDRGGQALPTTSWTFTVYGAVTPTTDPDGDGIPTFLEQVLGTNPNVANPGTDEDGDLLPDHGEVIFGTDPLVDDTDGDGISDANEDADGDDDPTKGLGMRLFLTTNADELLLLTDPFRRDSDGDGFEDGEEERDQSDPLDPASLPLHFAIGRLSERNVGALDDLGFTLGRVSVRNDTPPGAALGVASVQNDGGP